MKKKLKLSDNIIKMLLIEFGTCTNIAKKCNLSQVTISKAINGYPIGYKTRFRIEELIKKTHNEIPTKEIFQLINEE